MIISAGVMAVVSRQRRSRKQKRTFDAPDQRKGDLVVPIGSFLVCERGVTAKFRAPLNLLSRHYEWQWVASGLAALKLAAIGEGNSASLVYSRMDEKQKNDLETRLGEVSWSSDDSGSYFDHDSDLADSVKEIWDWMPSLAARCPYQSVVHDLGMVRSLDDKSLDEYVMGNLL